MKLTEEDLKVLSHHYKVKAACEEAQGNFDARDENLNRIKSIESQYKDDEVNYWS